MRYKREDGCRAWLTHGELPPETLREILREYGSCEALYERFVATKGSCLQGKVTSLQLEWLRRYAQPDEMHRMMQTMKDHDMGILSEEDFGFPDTLRDIPDAPVFLFYIGNPDVLMGRCLTMVGARKASPAGSDATRTVARELSLQGVTIISGLAMGIDTQAHEGCLEGESPTVGVMACGLDIDYPVENAALKKEIIQRGGLLLSEYPPGTPALPFRFPVRNRILAGLSRAVIMMECQIKSGSMTTVTHALNQGKDVYAYPGIPGTPWAEGAHQLLREGASFFAKAEDILEDLSWLDDKPMLKQQAAEALPSLTPDQRRIMTILTQGEQSFDQLCAASGLDTSTLSASLTMLQIMGLIKSLPGKSYIRA